MSSSPVGVYVVGDEIRSYGRGGHPRTGETFHAVTDPVARALLADHEDLVDLRWTGSTVSLRDQAEIDARKRDEMMAADGTAFDNKRAKAVFLVLFDEINRLRANAGLTPRTIAQARAAYRAKLNR